MISRIVVSVAVIVIANVAMDQLHKRGYVSRRYSFIYL